MNFKLFPAISLELSAFPLLLVKKLLEKGSRVNFNTVRGQYPTPPCPADIILEALYLWSTSPFEI